jgi:hypothetical protein
MKRLLSTLCAVMVLCLSLASCTGSAATGATYTVVYSGNGHTAGSAPTDSATYGTGDSVTVLPNSGGLFRPCRSLKVWNTSADGSGTDYAPGSSFAMGSADVTLYAKWTPFFTVKHYAQCDLPWRDHVMAGVAGDTICSTGTLLTSLAMMLTAEDPSVTPQTLDDFLDANGGYASGANIALTAINDYPTTTFTYLDKIAFGLASLKSELDLGNPVLVSLNSGASYIVVTEYSGTGTAYSDFPDRARISKTQGRTRSCPGT